MFRNRSEPPSVSCFGLVVAHLGHQVLGQIFVHFTNIAVSDLGSRFDAPNPCSHYFLNIVLDTTVGVLILWLFLQALTSLCVKRDPDSFQTGEYGTPFNWAIWGKQACVYVCALTLMKIVIVTFLLLVPQLGYVASWMISWAKDDETQVLIVMLVVPVVMNVTQFVIIDSILKSKAWAEYGSMKPDFDAGDEEEGLLGRPSTDDDHPRAPASSSGAALAVDTTLSPPLKKALESPKGPMSARSITTPMTPTSQGMTRARSSSLQRKMARNHYPPVQAIATPVAPLPPRALDEIELEKRNVHTEEKEQQEEQEEEEWGFEDEDWDDRDEDGEAAWGLDQSAGRLSKDSAEGIRTTRLSNDATA